MAAAARAYRGSSPLVRSPVEPWVRMSARGKPPEGGEGPAAGCRYGWLSRVLGLRALV